jgi:hypothetical protein
MGATVYINGKGHDYNSIKVTIDDEEYLGVTSVNYKPERQPGVGYGTHAQPIVFTEGQLNNTAAITLIKDTAKKIRAKLAAKASSGQSWMDVRFDITVSYETGDIDLATDYVIQARVVSVENNHSAGTDALVEAWDLNPLDIKIDGYSSVSNPLY